MDMLHVDFPGSPSLIQGMISNRLMGPVAPLVKKEGLDMQIIMDCLSAGCTLHSAVLHSYRMCAWVHSGRPTFSYTVHIIGSSNSNETDVEVMVL